MSFGGFESFGKEEFGAMFNIGCTVLGIGSLAFGRNFAMAGPWYSSFGLVLIAIINIYSSVSLSYLMRKAPEGVKTYSDLGYHVCGNTGRRLVISTQLVSCAAIPIAFLVLGGSIILPRMFEPIWFPGTANVFILLMAICILPVVYIRTLKEAAIVAFFGAAGTLVGDGVAIVDSLRNSPYYENAQADPTWITIFCIFGNMIMAFGAGLTIPSIQRDMSRPKNMPIIIAVTLIGASATYFFFGTIGYYQYGCRAPDNLLLSMTNRVFEWIALLAFLIHICIGFAVTLNPFLYTLERQFLGFNVEESHTGEKGLAIADSVVASPSSAVDTVIYINNDKMSPKKMVSLNEKEDDYPMSDRLKSMALRTTVVGVQVFLAMLLQGSFDQLADFIGATMMTFACVLLPVFFYWKQYRLKMSMLEQCWCWFILCLCGFCSLFTAYFYVKKIVETIGLMKPFHSVYRFDAIGMQHVTDPFEFCVHDKANQIKDIVL